MGNRIRGDMASYHKTIDISLNLKIYFVTDEVTILFYRVSLFYSALIPALSCIKIKS